MLFEETCEVVQSNIVCSDSSLEHCIQKYSQL